MKSYSELLVSWGLPTKAAEVCKIIAKAEELKENYRYGSVHRHRKGQCIRDILAFSEQSLGYQCAVPGFEARQEHETVITQELPQCRQCRRVSLRCSICELSVRGLLCICIVCGHGGHYEHMKQWFEDNDDCATGCGCKECFKTAVIS